MLASDIIVADVDPESGNRLKTQRYGNFILGLYVEQIFISVTVPVAISIAGCNRKNVFIVVGKFTTCIYFLVYLRLFAIV